MSKWTERRERLRALFAGDKCYFPCSVFDPLSARIGEDLGYEVAMLGGQIAALAVLGAPDLTLMTLTEYAEQIHRISRSSKMPMMVDADNGYGNALNAMRTVQEVEAAGAAGMTIDDAVLPAAFGSKGEAQMVSIEEAAAKVRAGLAARTDPKFVVAGRTIALLISNMDEAVARARAYEAAGADAVFFVRARSRSQVETISAAIKLPILLGNPLPEATDLEFLGRNRVRICVQPHKPLASAVQAIHNAMKALREGTHPNDLQNVASKEMMERVTRSSDYERWSKDFLE